MKKQSNVSDPKNIVVDLDDVLFDLFNPLRNSLNRYTGLNKQVFDFFDFDLSKVYPGLTMDEFYSIAHEDRLIEICNPIPGAKDALDIIKKKGYIINIVTARGWHEKALPITVEALKRNGLFYHNLYITNPGESKEIAYRQIDDKFACIIDDHIKNINQAIDSNLFTSHFLVSKPWNTSLRIPGNVIRWQSIKDISLFGLESFAE